MRRSEDDETYIIYKTSSIQSIASIGILAEFIVKLHYIAISRPAASDGIGKYDIQWTRRSV